MKPVIKGLEKHLKQKCKACEGSGKNSKGDRCYPCKGTGRQG